MKKKRENMLTRNEDNKLSGLNLRIAGIILSIFLVLAAVSIINVKLYQDFVSHQQMQRVLSQIAEQVHYLYELKVEIISNRTISQSDLNLIDNKRKFIREMIDKLEDESSQNIQFKKIHEVFNDYDVSLNLLFNLIAKDEFNQAKAFDREIIEPAYKKLNKVTTNTGGSHNEDLILKQSTFFKIGAAVTAIAFILLIILGRLLEKNRKALLFNDIMYSQIKFIFDASTEAICVIDRNFNVIRTNKTFVDKFGNYADRKCYELCFSKLCQTDKCHLDRIINGEDFVEDLIEKKLDDDSVGYYLVTGCPYYDSDGQLVGIIQNFKDVTERKKAEQLIKEEKEFAENLVLNSSIPTFVLDTQHKVLIWNKACEELTGVKAEEVLNTENHWQAFYKTKMQCLADAIIDNSLQQLPDRYKGMNKSKIISQGLHAETWAELSGKDKYLIIEAAPIFNSNNNLVAVIETLQDITDRKNAEEELLKFNQKIQLELELASMVQRSMLPKEILTTPNICTAWKFEPSIYVGGDMLDIFYLDDGKIGFYILDVKGHGISAALTAMTLNHHLRSDYQSKDLSYNNTTFSPSVTLTQLNEYFSSEINAFFTIIYGTLDTDSLVMTYARAGHCLPIIVSKDGSSIVPKQGGDAVGLLKNAVYTDIVLQLKQGDKVLLYTDGALESGNSISDIPFLINDLKNLVSTYRHDSIADIVDTVVFHAKKRTEALEVRDDITVLGLELS